MDDVTRMLIERACERLMVDYCATVDFGNASRLVDLFTPDGVWDAEGKVLDGHDAIHAHFLRREKKTRRVSRHFLANMAVDVQSEDEARSRCYFANFRFDRREGDETLPVPIGHAKYTGEYLSHFVRTPDGWRFKHIHVDVTFLRPPTPPPA